MRIIGLIVAVTVLGCGGPAAAPPGAVGGTPTGKEGVESLAQLLKDFQAEKKKPPAKMADIEKVEPVYPGAYIALVQGNISYAWGKPIEPATADTVIAHEKQTESAGGYVLMGDGTVKTMTADQFKAAKRAK